MSDLKIFNNQELGFKVRAMMNPDGSISVNAEDTAIGYGWTQTQVKNGKEYTSVRWERMNAFSAECGFPHEWGKDDYLPESLFYMLGFKAGNERALKYQQWLAIEVLPSIRKTGSYEIPSGKKLSPTEELRLHQEAILEVDEKISAVDKDLQNFKQDMPILGIEESRITAAVNRKGVYCLGGKQSLAYKDRSIRGKVFADIYGQIKRELGLPYSCTYKAIKRSQCELVVGIVEAYELPACLKMEIEVYNGDDFLY